MSNGYEWISPQEIRERLAKNEKLNMIDVREDDEVAAGMIPGAKHIRLSEIPDRYEEIEQTGEIILICRSGNRSGRACQYLASLGIPGLKNMSGGMLEWDDQE
ncbi:rhodanese-like domain-containing protein [Paenibacillus koleovorans]|uniref:rhodanese-like domain-containing protein n=1 Tax=Paenibacillus koleovorans TaxID=121608 RepID=UPI000FD9881B|nr:rhodanese-like domain-containing protein [Paenibacillus koleovorans]